MILRSVLHYLCYRKKQTQTDGLSKHVDLLSKRCHLVVYHDCTAYRLRAVVHAAFAFRAISDDYEMVRLLGDSAANPDSAGKAYLFLQGIRGIAGKSRGYGQPRWSGDSSDDRWTGGRRVLDVADCCSAHPARLWNRRWHSFTNGRARTHSSADRLTMETGLGKRWMGVSIRRTDQYHLQFYLYSVQNAICAAWQGAFGFDPTIVGIILALFVRCSSFSASAHCKVSSVIVPIIAVRLSSYSALFVVVINITELPNVIGTIFSLMPVSNNLPAAGSSAAMMQESSADSSVMRPVKALHRMSQPPHYVTHPETGLIQALGVFTDTLIICSCTASLSSLAGATRPGR